MTDTAGDDLPRLRRRLERERRARLDAEAIAERTTRTLYERQQELHLIEAVAVASNAALDVEDALLVAVDGVCAHTKWPVGHAYVRNGGVLVPTDIWHTADPVRYERFRQKTATLVMTEGVGLPGRVLASGNAEWIVDVTRDDNFPRAAVAKDVGLGAAFAFPVLVGEDVAGVLEFFAPAAAEPDAALLELMVHLGTQLGRVIERMDARAALQRLGRQNQLLLDCAGEGICGVDAQGIVTFLNPAAADMLGWASEEVVGRPVGMIQASEDEFSRKDGSTFPVEFISTPIVEDDQLVGTVITFSDTSDRKRFEAQLRHLADHDPLTGLLNRRRFEEELTRQVAHAERYEPGGALLLLDLDNFKFVNDTFGHHAGDDLIRGLCAVLRGQLRDTDVLARLGGDELAIILPHAAAEEAEMIANRLAEAVRRHPFAAGPNPVHVTASIGVATLGPDTGSAADALVQADLAMYEVKGRGRDGVAVHQEREDGAPERIQIAWSERIATALSEDRFVLHAQPILDLGTGQISQYEVLLRMYDDEGELVLPGAFLPEAERFGLVRDIDRWVTLEAIKLLTESDADGRSDFHLEVNLSGRSLGDQLLPDLIAQELAATKIDPARLIFEITETAAIANMEEARKFAHRLTRLGCRFALDDFGAGFGSFSYLKYLPLDYLKIDGEFIHALPKSGVDQRMVGAMVGVARSLGLKTIAEFVRDEETIRLLRDQGVDFAQGYYIGHPAPARELLAARPTASATTAPRPTRGPAAAGASASARARAV